MLVYIWVADFTINMQNAEIEKIEISTSHLEDVACLRIKFSNKSIPGKIFTGMTSNLMVWHLKLLVRSSMESNAMKVF